MTRPDPHRAVAFLALLLAALSTGALRPAKHKDPPKLTQGPRFAPTIDLATWINTKPLKRADLDGKVRLVEFWTFGCYNCQNTLPAMRELNETYAKRGLVIVGVHTPEFPVERDSAAVAAAVRKGGIRFPVALDNDYKVFNAFKNRYWPALYLVDRKGIIRATHIGELHVGTRAWRNFCDAIDTSLAAKAAARTRRS